MTRAKSGERRVLLPHSTISRVQPNALISAGIASTAIYASSTPGNAKPLGIELDPQIAYSGREGLFVAIEGGALLPLAGLDNPEMHLNAKMAGLVRLRIAFLF